MSEHYALPDIESAWRNRWWEKPVRRNQLRDTEARIQGLLELLQQYFGAAWAAKYPDYTGHPVYRNLVFGEGAHQIDGLLDIAERYERLLSVHGFKRVRESYEDPASWAAADLEMLMGDVFSRAGFLPEYIVPRSRIGKTPDLLVSRDDIRFTVECKRLQEANGEQWIESYQHSCWHLLQQAAGENSLYMSVDRPYLDIREYGFPDHLTPAQLAAHIDLMPVVKFIEVAIRKRQMNRLMRFRGRDIALMCGSLSGIGSVTLPGLNEEFLIRRLMGNGFGAGATQVNSYFSREGIPGVVVIWQAQPCSFPRLGRRIAEALLEDQHRGVVGVLVNQMGNILSYQRPLWVGSPSYKNTVLLEVIEGRIREAFAPYMYGAAPSHE